LKNYREKHLYFGFRRRKTTQIKGGSKYCQVQQLKVNVGSKKIITKSKNNSNQASRSPKFIKI